MNEQDHPHNEAFLLEMSHPEPGAPDGHARVRYIAVTPSRLKAIAAVRDKRMKPCTIEVVDSGPDVMATAVRLGLGDGGIKILADPQDRPAP